MDQYLSLLKEVLINGDLQYNDRTGQLMIASSGEQKKFELEKGFPLCTTKASAPIRWIAEELFWMLRGERNAKTLYDKGGVDIWNRNAFAGYLKRNGLESQIPINTLNWNSEFKRYEEKMKSNEGKLEDFDLGPVYGAQWRHWKGSDLVEHDQLARLIESIKSDKGSRYHTLCAWNVAELPQMALKPCHVFAHFTVTNDSDLDLHMFQRSCDVYLGVPFNIAQYSLLNHLVAQETGLNARRFIHTFSNVHIYCGVEPRSGFVRENIKEIQHEVKHCMWPGDYMDIREWYLKNAPLESPGNERKDHIPFILQQLSYMPKKSPKLEVKKMPLFELITQPAKDVVKLIGYDPIKWDSKAAMAA